MPVSLLLYILGLAVGSFLNVVILRLKIKKSLNGRSYCPGCKKTLEARDLVPLFSFIFLGGKCRFCEKKISWQYPLVEFFTALVFFLLSLQYPLGIELFFFCILSSFLIVVAVYDYKHFLILDKVVFPGIAVALVFALLKDFTAGCWLSLDCAVISGLLGVLSISGFFFLQYWYSKGRWIGFGDVKFGILLGLTVGFPLSIVLMFVAYMSGAVVGTALIAMDKKEMSSKLPFGSFLALSAIFTVLYGQAVLDWYLNLIGIV
jgi:leader peptidase (prepilin peptidase) / N-methyltransferase